MWTKEEIEQLLHLKELKLNMQQIANHLPGKTKNAVIGKLNRMNKGLKKTNGNKKTGRRRKITIPKISEKPVLRSSAFMQQPLEEGAGLQLVDLEAHHCRFPIGDPKEPGFHFCGRPKGADWKNPAMKRPYPASYCLEHAHLVTQEPGRAWTDKQKAAKKREIAKKLGVQGGGPWV